LDFRSRSIFWALGDISSLSHLNFREEGYL
jgi:hypothetical protein